MAKRALDYLASLHTGPRLIADRQRLSRNSEAAHPACSKRRLLDKYQWQSALVVWILVDNLYFMTASNWTAAFSRANLDQVCGVKRNRAISCRASKGMNKTIPAMSTECLEQK